MKLGDDCNGFNVWVLLCGIGLTTAISAGLWILLSPEGYWSRIATMMLLTPIVFGCLVLTALAANED